MLATTLVIASDQASLSGNNAKKKKKNEDKI